MREHPRYNIVSVRASDDEWEMLHEIARETRQSVSEIMRAAMHLIITEKGSMGRERKEAQPVKARRNTGVMR